jgi:hypothetical protein
MVKPNNNNNVNKTNNSKQLNNNHNVNNVNNSKNNGKTK